MSGIAGLYYPGTPKPVDPARINAMIAALAHRGPDGSGVWTAPGVGLGHCRLATIGDQPQPMATDDQGVIISFDGAIHNFRALRTELETHGLRFRTDTDTEVLLQGWRAWGPGLVEHLEGSFALAIFDEGWRSLFLARDRFGAKPLHYTELSDGAVAFASELKGLLAHPVVRRQPDFHAVEDYLGLGYVPDDACIIAGVRKLAAGHFLLLERGKPVPQPQRWWDIDFSKRAKGKIADLEAELAARMRSAVLGAMVADVPVGVLLADGIDSAALVALMAEASRRAVRTVAIGDAGAGVVSRFATEHVRDRGAESFAMLDALAAAFDEPFGDPAAVESWRLAALGRRAFAVGLAGDGADEVLAGHPRYRAFVRAERTRRLLPQKPRTAVFDALGKVHSPLAALGEGGEFAYPRAIAVTPSALRQKLYSPAARKALGGHRAERRYTDAMRRANARDPIDRAQYADLVVALPGAVLARADRTGMAAGLEVREPWLDHRLVQFAASLPPSLRIKAGQGKWLMRKAMEAWLPRELRGDAVAEPPVGEWFRGALAETAAGLARSPVLGQTGWFDERAVEKLASDHRAGKADHGRTLWQLLMLERSLLQLF